MFKLLQYFARYQSARGMVGGLPGWAKFVLLIVALPGIAGILLSVLALCVSIAALLLLAVPVYRVLNAIAGGGRRESEPPAERGPTEFVDASPADFVAKDAGIATTFVSPQNVPDRPRRQIDVRIVD